MTVRLATFRLLVKVAILAAKLTLGILFWATDRALTSPGRSRASR